MSRLIVSGFPSNGGLIRYVTSPVWEITRCSIGLDRVMESSNTSDNGENVYRLQRHKSLTDVSKSSQSATLYSHAENGTRHDEVIQKPNDFKQQGVACTRALGERIQHRRYTVLSDAIHMQQERSKKNILMKRKSLPAFHMTTSSRSSKSSVPSDNDSICCNGTSDHRLQDEISKLKLCERFSGRLNNTSISPSFKQQTSKRHMMIKRLSLPSFKSTGSPLPSIESTGLNENIVNDGQTSKDIKQLELASNPTSDTKHEKLSRRRYTLIAAPAQLHEQQKRVLTKRLSLPTMKQTEYVDPITSDSSVGCSNVLGATNAPSLNTQTDTSETSAPIQCYCLRCQIMMRLCKTGDKQLEMWGNYPCFRR